MRLRLGDRATAFAHHAQLAPVLPLRHDGQHT